MCGNIKPFVPEYYRKKQTTLVHRLKHDGYTEVFDLWEQKLPLLNLNEHKDSNRFKQI